MCKRQDRAFRDNLGNSGRLRSLCGRSHGSIRAKGFEDDEMHNANQKLAR